MIKMNVGVVGVGNMGRHHARIYYELDNANLVAIADINEDVKKIAEKYNCKFYKNYKEMLEKEDLDAVSVVVPTKLHKEVALDVINAGKHILLEKPIASNVEDARIIIDVAKKNNVKLFIGHIERFNPAVQRLKELIDDGRLGKINSVIVRRVGLPPPNIKDNNVIVDLAVHDIDVMKYLLNEEPKLLHSVARGALIKDSHDSAEIFLRYGEASGFVQVSWITPVKIRSLVVTGTKAYVELDYVNQKLILYENSKRDDLKFNDFNDFINKFGMPDVIDVGINKQEPLMNEIKSFLSCIEEDKNPMMDGEDALLALRIALESFK